MDTTHAALPQSPQHGTDRHDDLERLLRAEIRDSEDRGAGIEGEIVRLTELREQHRQVVEQARAMLRAIGREAEAPEPASSTSTNGVRPMRPTRDNFVAGNRSNKAPERRPEFASVSLIDAAKQLLRAGETMRLDDLAHAIYDIRDAERLPVAKANVRSAMAAGVDRGFWTREGPGAFRVLRPEDRQMST